MCRLPQTNPLDAFRPLAHYGTREFAQLSHSFLDMAEQLARRSDYIATFSAHLTHELKSPLTSIKGAAELLLDCGSGLKTFYDLDTPVTLAELNAGRATSYIGPRGLQDFDLVLSYTGGVALQHLKEKLGAPCVAPLYGSVDPEVHCRVLLTAPPSRRGREL